jgi:hypothetical protein
MDALLYHFLTSLFSCSGAGSYMGVLFVYLFAAFALGDSEMIRKYLHFRVFGKTSIPASETGYTDLAQYL